MPILAIVQNQTHGKRRHFGEEQYKAEHKFIWSGGPFREEFSSSGICPSRLMKTDGSPCEVGKIRRNKK
jgi:hypothetical protein